MLAVVVALAVMLVGGLVACSSDSAPTSLAEDVPLQTGQQTALFEAVAVNAMAVDGQNILYLGGVTGGIREFVPGADEPTPLNGVPVTSLAAAPDGTLYFARVDSTIHMLKPGSADPEPLPFGELRRRGQIAVGHDGTVYVGDNENDKLLKLTPGAEQPAEVSVDGVQGFGHMVVDADDTLYFSAMGKIMKLPPNETTAEPVQGAPDRAGALAVDAAGNLYATDNAAGTVSRMPAGGGDWVELPFADIRSPTKIAVDGDGTVYVVADIGQARGLHVIRLAAK